jgi:hypothetical protein
MQSLDQLQVTSRMDRLIIFVPILFSAKRFLSELASGDVWCQKYYIPVTCWACVSCLENRRNGLLIVVLR